MYRITQLQEVMKHIASKGKEYPYSSELFQMQQKHINEILTSIQSQEVAESQLHEVFALLSENPDLTNELLLFQVSGFSADELKRMRKYEQYNNIIKPLREYKKIEQGLPMIILLSN